MDKLANVFFLFALLPFTSPLPGSSDIQLPAFVIALFIIAIDLARGHFRLTIVEYAFLAIAIWSLCFVLPSAEFKLRERGGLMASFLIYWVVRRHGGRFSYRTLYVAIVLTFAITLLQFFFPDVYGYLAPHLVRTVKDIQYGRGMSGPTPEPSALATVTLTHGLLTFYYRKYAGMGDKQFLSALGFSGAVLALSRSATGFVFLVILCGIAIGYLAFYGMKARRWAMLVLSVGFGLSMLLGPLADTRGGIVLTTLLQSPSREAADGSLQERERCLAVGLLSLMHYPLGAGGGTFPDVAREMQQRYPINRVFFNANPRGVVGVLNAGGLYLVEMGILYIFFVAMILAASFRIEVIHMMMLWLAFTFLVIAGSITSPLTWIMLGLMARKRSARIPYRPALAA